MVSITTIIKALAGGPATLAYTLLRAVGITNTLVLVIRVVQVSLLMAVFAAVAFKGLSMLGYDPLAIIWALFVDVLEAALREVLGDKFSL
ncbi:hypothetical protein [Halostella litorea]|uniref:hypothetical protein n=1 Tax=Halostella litorea TaxID=2528831 RepID=UPI001091C3F2|nr:hypothetical protein [Halostella litorea]